MTTETWETWMHELTLWASDALDLGLPAASRVAGAVLARADFPRTLGWGITDIGARDLAGYLGKLDRGWLAEQAKGGAS